jgi:hypothetical protein
MQQSLPSVPATFLPAAAAAAAGAAPVVLLLQQALMQDCATYFKVTGRRVTFEYTLLAGVNDSPAHVSAVSSAIDDDAGCTCIALVMISTTAPASGVWILLFHITAVSPAVSESCWGVVWSLGNAAENSAPVVHISASYCSSGASSGGLSCQRSWTP